VTILAIADTSIPGLLVVALPVEIHMLVVVVAVVVAHIGKHKPLLGEERMVIFVQWLEMVWLQGVELEEKGKGMAAVGNTDSRTFFPVEDKIL
jgi:hypothetical protein